MKLDLYNQKGEKKGQLEVSDQIFGQEFNEDLVHQFMVMQMANQRIAVAHTKKRGEVRGGGRKPYRQKGTGHARQGSIRNVHYRGGCVVFGPRNDRNFSKAMPKKQRRKALFCALSQKVSNKQVMILDEFKTEQTKTKNVAEMLKFLGVNRNALIVIGKEEKVLNLSARNLPNAKVIQAEYINILDLQKHESVIFLESAVKKTEEIFLT